MKIMKLVGGEAHERQAAAQFLRSQQIDAGKGCTIIRDDNAPIEGQLEKIISAQPFVPGQRFDTIPWKPGSLIILTEETDWLDRAEALLPGISALPTETLGVPLK